MRGMKDTVPSEVAKTVSDGKRTFTVISAKTETSKSESHLSSGAVGGSLASDQPTSLPSEFCIAL